MTSFKQYGLYHAKSTLLRLAVIAVLCLLLTSAFFSVTVYQADGKVSYRTISTGVLAFVIGMLATVMPILELAGFKNRRNLDMLFFMPVSRSKMAAVHYLNGLWQTVAVFSLCFLFGFLQMLPHAAYFDLSLLLPYYLLLLLTGVLLYSIFTFVFSQAETVADGVVMMGLYVFLLLILAFTASLLVDSDRLMTLSGQLWLYDPLGKAVDAYHDLLLGRAPGEGFHAGQYIGLAILGVAATAGYFLTFARHRAEKTEGISDSFFGYRVLIPIYGLCCAIISIGVFGTYFLTLIAMVIGYVIYRRGLRLKVSDLMMLGLSFVAFVIGGLL